MLELVRFMHFNNVDNRRNVHGLVPGRIRIPVRAPGRSGSIPGSDQPAQAPVRTGPVAGRGQLHGPPE